MKNLELLDLFSHLKFNCMDYVSYNQTEQLTNNDVLKER